MYKLIFTLIIAQLLIGCGASKSQSTADDQILSSPKPKVTNVGNGTPSQVKGSVRDEDGMEIIGAKILLIQNGVTITGALTDMDGKFVINRVEPGTYDLEVNVLGYQPSLIQNVKVESSVIVDFELIEMETPHVITLKPVIYLYPEQETEISVQLNYKGKLTHTYPKYPEQGWSVKASPNGTLYDRNGQEYYALFWEGKPSEEIIPQDGFIIAGNETVAFLEVKLAELGLNRREANEFIMFWLPQLENNPYNLIHFSGEAYEDLAELNITPKPETIIRVMMIYKPLQQKIDFPLQDISPLKKVRKGYTVVEWGGSLVSKLLN